MKLQTAREIRAMSQGPGDWFRIVNKGAAADVFLYDEIGVWGTTAKDFTAQLADLTASELNVFVSSIGGEVFDGIAIYNALRTHTAQVNVRVDSMAASIASVIVQAGDTRSMLSGSQMMIHNASMIAGGDAEAMRQAADILDRQNAVIADIYAERSGKAAADFLPMMAAETWMNAAEAVDAGLADVVVTPPAKGTGDSKDTATTDTSAKLWDDFIASTRIEV